jgi:catechol 2,3-dioxygenase-like lactoylglutathione lyase family enzyme
MLTFGRLAPSLPVADLTRTIDFYTRHLGMRCTFTNGTPPSFAILVRDAAELLVELDAAAASAAPARATNAAHLLVSDATQLHDALVAAGVRIVKPLRDAPYGLRDFVFADPDGHRIDVGEPR